MTKIPDAVLEQLSELVVQFTGLHFPASRWPDLQRGIIAAAPDFGFPDPIRCAEWLLSSGLEKGHIEVLASHLTIGETYFFRDAGVFKALDEQILPALISGRRSTQQRLKFWSAGCATGEEPISLAIQLKRQIPDLSSWQITLLGTDINPRSLKKAEDRIFSRWSFRHAPPWLDQYFEKTAQGGFVLNDDIKRLVNFFYLNLVEDVYPSLLNSTNAMDVIFCRNVLMYLAPEHAKMVIAKLSHCLVEGGWLFVAPCEASHWLYEHQFTSERFEDTIAYRKCSSNQTVLVPGPSLPSTDRASTLPENSNVVPPAEQFKPAALPRRIIKPDKPPGFKKATTADAGRSKPAGLDATKTDAGRSKPVRLDATNADAGRSKALGLDATKIDATRSKPLDIDTIKLDASYSNALDLFEKGSYKEAADSLLSLIEHDKTNTQALFLLARTFANLGDLDQALKWCQKSIATDKLNPIAHYLEATILQETGAFAEAIISLTRALYLDSDLVIAHFALGKIAQRAGKKEDAKKHFQRAISCLQSYSRDDIVPESGGMTAGRLSEIIRLTVTET